MTDEIIARLHRVEGQIRGIEGMVARGASFSEVLTQIAAARAALDAAGVALLDRRLHECLDHLDGQSQAAELVAALERFVRR